MSNFSAYLESALLGATVLGSPFTALGTIFLSLATSVASDGSSYTEVASGLGYVRYPLATGVEWSGITSTPDTSVVNSATLNFTPATTPWGVVRHFALYDSATIGGGNQLFWGDLGLIRDIQTTDVFKVNAGSLTVRFD